MDKKQETNKNEHELTPHTLRLIKLITSSSYSSATSHENKNRNSSTDHVKHAISLLSNIASKSHPFVLWDILARLYSYLTNRTEVNEGTKFDDDSILTKREHIALAMEYVAKYIPPSDRRHFLMDSSVMEINGIGGSSKDDDEYMHWLTVQDFLESSDNLSLGEKSSSSSSCLLENNTSLDQILKHGRLLLSSNGLQYENYNNDNYEREHSILSSLDTSTIASSCAEEQSMWLKKRIKVQRQILAHRLGLGCIDSILNSDGMFMTNDLITDEDLISEREADNEPLSEKEVPKLSARERNMKRIQKRMQGESTTTNNGNNKKVKFDEASLTQGDQNADDTDKSNGGTSTIRNILLLSLNHQQNTKSNNATNDLSLISHKNPQVVLATDMIYNSFHPSWHIRHGSLLGLSALLKAWRGGFSSDTCSDNKIQHFGPWPEDIVCRCLCILALDRFGDFAGAIIESSGHDFNDTRTNIINDQGCDEKVFHFDNRIKESAYSAPVRETAAKVLSMLLSIAPRERIQKPCYQVLNKLASYKQEWEVRHGAMITFKHIAALIKQDYQPDQKYHHFEDSLWAAVANNAIEGLKDQYDDVKGAAAQVLNSFVKRSHHNEAVDAKITGIISSGAEQMWQALIEVNNTSSCTLDLLLLFSEAIRADCKIVLQSIGVFDSDNSQCNMEQLLNKMCDFLDFDDYSVRLSCFHTLSDIAEPIAKALKNLTDTFGLTVQVYCKLLRQLFQSYFHDCTDIASNYEVDDDDDEESVISKKYTMMFISARETTWSAIIDSLKLLIKDGEVSLVQQTFMMLLMQLLDTSLGPSTFTPDRSLRYSIRSNKSAFFQCLNSACKALAEVYNKLSLTSIVDGPLTVFLICSMKSLWPEICECSCILLRSLVSNMSAKNNAFIASECHLILQMVLVDNPHSILVNNYPDVNLALEDEPTRAICKKILVKTLEAPLDEVDIEPGPWVRSQVNQVVEAWSKVFKAFNIAVFEECNEVMKTKSKDQMRLNASIAGAYVSLGLKYLPSKLTSIIRALITSITNEDDAYRSEESSQYVVLLVKILDQSSLPQHSVVVKKIFEKVCNLASKDPEYIQSASGSLALHSWKAAQRILYLVVQSMPTSDDLSKMVVLWRWIACLQTPDPASIDVDHLKSAVSIFNGISSALQKDSTAYGQVISSILPTLVLLACAHNVTYVREKAVDSIISTCLIDPEQSVVIVLPYLLNALNTVDDDACRLGACTLMITIVERLGVLMIPYVSVLLPVSMATMTDPVERCAKLAAATFAYLVRLAPLVQTRQVDNISFTFKDIKVNGVKEDEMFKKVVDHLIHGKALPAFSLPKDLLCSLAKSNILLRHYQEEGIAWLCFLRTLKLNGALCDDMGLGKTLQALIAIVMAHEEIKRTKANTSNSKNTHSLIVCPSSVVGHWLNEIARIDPDRKFLSPLCYVGKSRQGAWNESFDETNIVITSYPILRSDSTFLKNYSWIYCVLDEGHLIKNPSSATAKAARYLRPNHKLLLSGSPVQNHVQELWAAFDWLMPNYLGSHRDFAKRFAHDISKSQLPGTSIVNVKRGSHKLKLLHQQVLPFILRREKCDVLQQLPPKIIIDIPCCLSEIQLSLYDNLIRNEGTKGAIHCFESLVANEKTTDKAQIPKSALKSLMPLRLLCTHPLLLVGEECNTLNNGIDEGSLARFDLSGKLSAFCDLLRNAAILREDITAADNDTSTIFQNIDSITENSSLMTFEPGGDDCFGNQTCGEDNKKGNLSKCLIFAQFTHSLDILENLIFKPLMPSLRYCRLDGSIDPIRRANIVKQFVDDESVSCMLLTTKVGSLGLNLHVANIVIILEPDYNPHVDLQAMDRVHRIGQEKTVYVYRLFTSDTIEEKIMVLQRKKIAISKAIINTENSTLFSMGTDRLLDLFDTNE